MRLRLTSAYEYLERRFNYSVRALAAIFCLLLIFGWISVVVLTASMALVEITRIEAILPFINDADSAVYATILGVGAFSIFYTTLGGYDKKPHHHFSITGSKRFYSSTSPSRLIIVRYSNVCFHKFYIKFSLIFAKINQFSSSNKIEKEK